MEVEGEGEKKFWKPKMGRPESVKYFVWTLLKFPVVERLFPKNAK